MYYYIHTDHLDTPRVVVDKNNTIRWRWMAEPFGTTTAETNPSGPGTFAFHLRFPGQYFDQESGLHYNYWCYYDPNAGGRYTTPDPLGLDGGDVSLYSNVGNAPSRKSIPLGFRTESTSTSRRTNRALAVALGAPEEAEASRHSARRPQREARLLPRRLSKRPTMRRVLKQPV